MIPGIPTVPLKDNKLYQANLGTFMRLQGLLKGPVEDGVADLVATLMNPPMSFEGSHRIPMRGIAHGSASGEESPCVTLRVFGMDEKDRNIWIIGEYSSDGSPIMKFGLLPEAHSEYEQSILLIQLEFPWMRDEHAERFAQGLKAAAEALAS